MSPGAWLTALEGTEAGLNLAVALALLAAFLHALFSALQKGRHDPWLSRAAIDLSAGLIALPVALFLVPWPEPHLWPILAGAFFIHAVYKYLQAMAFQRGAFTVVYPVVRGTAPLFTVLGGWLLFRETFNPGQWAGLAVLLGGIYGLALYNLRHVSVGRETLVPALWLALATGFLVAFYTTYDAYGIRSTADPFTFIAWFFVVDSIFMPLVVGRRWAQLPRSEYGSLLRRGLAGGSIAIISFGSIMLATRLGPVGQAAALRETSTVFAALIGWALLGERVGPQRLVLVGLIAVGAVIIQLAA